MSVIIGKPIQLQHQPDCPVCGKLLDGVFGMGHETTEPSPGDVTICSGCMTPLRFTEDIALRTMSPEEEAAMPQEIRDLVENGREFIRLNNMLTRREP